jgi:hypothetical protein
MALTGLASIALLIFTIQILIVAFQESIGWGLGSLIVPFVILVFVFTHWEQTKTPFLRSIIAMVVLALGSGLSVFGMMHH